MASKRRLRRKCAAKVAYQTLAEARAALAKHPPDAQHALSPYRCRFCHLFHLGHLPRHVRQAIMERRHETV